MAASYQDIHEALLESKQKLFKKANVVATGIGYKTVNGITTPELSIICSVSQKSALPSLSRSNTIPRDIDGIPTDVYPSGVIYAQQNPKYKFRPAPGGVSIGHENITAGTLGCIVKRGSKKFILSNNHVLANSNDAYYGDSIVQPGPYDGGTPPRDMIATLEEYVPIEFEGSSAPGGGGDICSIARFFGGIMNAFAKMVGSKSRLVVTKIQGVENLVDAAIALPMNDSLVTEEILNIGKIAGLSEAVLRTPIKKMGRTTGVTTGIIQQIDATVKVNYGSNKTAIFSDQLIAGAMSQGGDSGSAILDSNNNLIGLLFAGSNSTTIINRIRNVFNALELTL